MSGKFFENGAVVIAVWPNGSGEMKATFQYTHDADEFCMQPRDKGGPMYIRVSMYDGDFRGFPGEPCEPQDP